MSDQPSIPLLGASLQHANDMSPILNIQPRAADQASVFLLDDEADILAEYAEFLGFSGHICYHGTDPRRAVQTIAGAPHINVVVTDMRMPGLDGWAFIKLLTETLAPNRSVRFIIVTGDDAECAEARRAGIPVLLKPIDLRSLVNEVRRQCTAG